MKPVTPDDVGRHAGDAFPDEVIAAFNECITKAWDGAAAEFKQDEVIKSILGRMPTIERHEVFENRWLDVEAIYRGAGWTVVYEKPGYNESGAAVFTFRRRTR